MSDYFCRFRRRDKRKLTKTQWHCQLEKNLTPIAEAISERASCFVKKIFESELSQNTEQLFIEWSYTIQNPIPSPICSKIMNENQSHVSFRCYDCMQSTSSCICLQCFSKGNHKGHNYIQYAAVNGCCDCGNPEAWNEKGFCPVHKQASHQHFDIENDVRKRFLEEYELAFYVYCAFEELRQNDRVKEYYGSQLFQSLVSVTSENYQMKLLGFELLESKFSSKYPKLDHPERTMLERLFYADPTAIGLSNSLHFLFEIFPVQNFRKAVLHEYFKKMLRTDEGFNSDHPLSGLNFQFLTCTKLISKMIKEKELQPLQITKKENITNTIFIEEAFLKYYEDLDYISHMKSGHDYHILHLKLMNVSEMAYYRKFCEKKQDGDVDEIRICLDEMFLKVLTKMIKSARHEKEIMLKCARELFEFACQQDPNHCSLAQERAFALFVMAYFEGDLSQLYSLDSCELFLKKMGLNQQNAGPVLKKLCLNSLKTLYFMGDHSYEPHNQYQQYFLRTHSQRHVRLFLDTIFHKILILLSRRFFNYDELITELFKFMKATKESYIKVMCAHFDDSESEEDFTEAKRQNSLNLEKQYVGQLNRIFGFLNNLYLIDLDEILINNFIGNAQVNKMVDFYGRTLSSFKQLPVKQFESLGMTIFQNQEVFELFVSQHTIIQRGRIRTMKPYKPLETYIYKDIFTDYSKELTQAQIVFLSTPEDNPYKEVKMFNKDSAMMLQEECMNLIEFLACNENTELKDVFSALSMEFFKIYYLGKCDCNPWYFHSLMNDNLRTIVSQDLLKQIVLIEKKDEDQQVQKDRIKDQKDLSDKKKKERFMNKRKEKEEEMRKKQAKLLQAYKGTEQNEEQTGTMSQCIYCKQSKQESLNYISNVHFTNLIEKSYLKYDNHSHLTITTCGHKIHSSCYALVYDDQNSALSCFLCKSKVNILIPELSTIKSQEEQSKKAKQFLNSLLPIMVEYFFSSEDIIKNLLQNNGVLSSLLIQLARDLVYIGLHDFKYFQKSLYSLYRQLYLIVSIQEKQNLTIAINNILKDNLAIPGFMDQQLNIIQTHILSLLVQKLQLPVEDIIQGKLPEHIINSTHKIVNFLTMSESMRPEIDNLSIIDQSKLFIVMPETLADLHTYMGYCNNCPNITNQTYKCILCGWTLCRMCISQLYKHGKNVHLEGTVFVSCFNGAIKYISQGKIFEDDSVYFNYMGTSFLESNALDALSRPDKYKLNRSKLKEIHDLILHYGIAQIVFAHDS